MNRHFAALAAGLVATATANAAVLYTTDFETDQSSNFTVAISSADTEADFNYDYSTWSPTSPTAGIATIPAAPSAAGTKALKIRANFDGTGTNEGVTAFINVSTGQTDWTLTFDAFQLWNGPDAISATGSTTFMGFGNSNTGEPFYSGATAFDGWFAGLTCEGGSGTDARYYSAAVGAPTLTTATPNWFGTGTADIGAPTANWNGVFSAANSYQPEGSPGRQWVTWRVQADSGAGTVTVSVTPVGGSLTQIASWTQATGKTAGIGFWDLFTGSVADPASDNFVLVDNLTLEGTVTATEDWAVYE